MYKYSSFSAASTAFPPFASFLLSFIRLNMKVFHCTVVTLAITLCAIPSAQAGLGAYGICQTGKSLAFPDSIVLRQSLAFVGCNTLAVACYTAAGAVFGTVNADADTPAAILGCNTALGKCSRACAAAVALTPTGPTQGLECATQCK